MIATIKLMTYIDPKSNNEREVHSKLLVFTTQNRAKRTTNSHYIKIIVSTTQLNFFLPLPSGNHFDAS